MFLDIFCGGVAIRAATVWWCTTDTLMEFRITFPQSDSNVRLGLVTAIRWLVKWQRFGQEICRKSQMSYRAPLKYAPVSQTETTSVFSTIRGTYTIK